MTNELWQMSATQLHVAYRAGDTRPSEVIEAVLARIVAVNPALNAFAHLDEPGARAAAAASDKRWKAGAPLGPTDGVPITVKDNITVKGMPCTWGSKLYLDLIPEEEEPPVAAARAQGAVILGKTSCSEFGRGQGTVNTLAFGIVRNPWNPDLTSGSSTGGGAAAVAAGFGPIAIATDGGGSTRRPAAYCGLLGMKTTTGRIPRLHGLPEMHHDMEVIGYLTRSVDDLALIMSLTQGPAPLDRLSVGFTPNEKEPPTPKAQRILYVPRFGSKPVDAPMTTSVAAAAANLAAMGHHVEEGPAPFNIERFEKYKSIMGASGLAWLLRDTEWRGKIGEEYTAQIESGGKMTAMDYIEALASCRDLFIEIAQCFEKYDLIMTPSAGAVPWRAHEFGPSHHATFTAFVNSAGVPALSVPCDPTPDGVPLGFQLVAPFGADWKLLAMARAYEQRHPWAARWPALSAESAEPQRAAVA